MDSKTANSLLKDLKKLCEKYGLPNDFMVVADEEECIQFIFSKQDESDNGNDNDSL